MRHSHVSQTAFRDGMACLAGAVNIVTTDGDAGRSGFTASAVCSVTDTPPTLLVCLNRSSSAAPAFLENDVLCVNTVGPVHQDLAMLFGGKTPMQARFETAAWGRAVTGAPVLEQAVVSFDCLITHSHAVGTHEVLFCEVVGIVQDAGAPASAYFGRRFHELRA
ncbi:FMN reductase [Pseudooceanicola sediminis]|uniref:FMN reductase n=1 Tax=Pseudooceanicola sediminis TaxID=2211117 RepID=A0A399J2J4_9RHOB|nr:flavin reductase [Pseudooceanicola sediminis]KAA2317299.1 FMN reductase [Puniceibacterium sp. HSS470]RII39653.1 FMN reductase [Pseudooceanicola sediminis]|tara:strand:- start:33546 stop:34037 length:492 start_codon:yes stop_codon:yes gene_type:complete